MKATAVILLALGLILGPVAWTLEACLDGHPHDLIAEYVSGQEHQDDAEETAPSIHCVVWDQPFGAVLRSAVSETIRSDEICRLQDISPQAAASVRVDNTLWLEALFKTYRSGFLHIPIARHLFLSVFRI